MNNTFDKAVGDSTAVATDGSALYYALLYLEPSVSTRVIETLQFMNTLSTTLNDVTEGQVAEKKIHWWHEELARVAKKQSRHPACIPVQHYLNDTKSIAASLAILSATATERYAPASDEQTLNDMIRADYVARLTLIDTAINSTPGSTAKTIKHAGAQAITFQPKSEISNGANPATQKSDAIALGLGKFDRLNSLPYRLRCGYAVFSDQCYSKHQLTPDDLLKYARPDSTLSADGAKKIRALINNAVIDVHSDIEQALNYIVAHRKSEPTNLAVQILCQVRNKQLKLWKKRKPDLLNESIALTPLKKFFIAYRTKRRFEQP